MRISEAQELIMRIYGERDRRRGIHRTALHLGEEVGELFRSIRTKNDDNLREEFADVLAWLLSLADLLSLDLESAFIDRYGKGCPKCGSIPCRCPEV